MEVILTEKLRKARKYIRAIFIIGTFLSIFLLLLTAGILAYAKLQGPPPLAVPQSAIFYANDGTVIGEMHHGEKRYWVPLEKISPYLIKATLSIEDKQFYKHHGFDGKRIIGAAVADIKARAKVQGASTITQQYARNLFLEHEKTWTRKLHEAWYTIRLEMNYDKGKILEGYLNTIYYGHGAYGIEAAAEYYFGKKAGELTLSEASLLAGIPKWPSRYSPRSNMEAAKKRQQVILTSMVEDGILTQREANKAYSQPLSVKKLVRKETLKGASYFFDAAKSELKKELHLTEQKIKTSGLRIYTSLDPRLQTIAEQTVEDVFNPKTELQVAFVAMDQKSGFVKALIGGRDYDQSPFNRATQAIRQPGSTIKPFLYYAALENGFTPSTSMRSEHTTFTLNDGVSSYTPSNFNHYYANDSITLQQAIALSDNVYAVKTHLFLGQDKLVEIAKRAGISTPLKKVPSLALGTSPVKLIEMVNGYSIIANGGWEVQPSFIKKVETYDGEVIYDAARERKRILDRDTAFLTTQLMTGMFDPKLNGYTTVTGTPILKYLSRTYAGKSGTTSTDSWMIGYSPELTTGVWTGYDRDKTMDMVEERGYAKKIWALFMEEALKEEAASSFKPPKGVTAVYIDPQSGKLATPGCPISKLTYYKRGTEPSEYCTDHLLYEEKKKEKSEKTEDPTWYDKLFKWLN
ncbi:transglycosylase domain-containing protein [Bacillus songklensis]|uniref:Transglycosylase domain-containing protein n=1 Tax=Bacillus songklensis TaxID=1069116 RepID=A0ABV8BB60_9BACI